MSNDFIEFLREMGMPDFAEDEAREFWIKHHFIAIRSLQDYTKRLRLETERLANAIEQTLAENAHLADGEKCTLWRLKQAIGM